MKNTLLLAILCLTLSLNSPAFAKSETLTSKNLKAITLDELKNQYPKASFKVVSLEELKKIKRYKTKDPCEYFNFHFQAYTPNYSKYISEYNHQVNLDFEGKINVSQKARYDSDTFLNIGSHSSGSDKDFLVYVAVIGLVVVAALVIYSATYLIKSATNDMQCRAWREFGYRHSSIADNNSNQIRSGKLNGAYYSHAYFLPIAAIGLTLEAGHFDFNLLEKNNNKVSLFTGSYLLLGPSFTFPLFGRTGHAFQLELLAGTSSNKEVDLLSTLKFGYSFNVNKRLRLSLNTGAALVQVNLEEGIVSKYDDLNYLSGFQFSFSY